MALLIDLHRGGARQGPGSDHATRHAIGLSGLSGLNGLVIADVGCGTGASTLILAAELNAQVVAVDLASAFLDELNARLRGSREHRNVSTVVGSLEALPFEEESLDAIWSEGAIYNVGFERGIALMRRLLKPGGVLAVSDLIWLADGRPAALEEYWMGEYPEIATCVEKKEILEGCGYELLGSFTLDESCWRDNYYSPLRGRFPGFLRRHQESDAAKRIVQAELNEIQLYEWYAPYYGYGYYIARRSGE